MELLTALLMAMQGAASQGLLWGVMALGVFITFRILDFPDLTVDGSFATGGAVTAIMITKGFNPFLSLFVALLAGMAAGAVTGLLHTKLKIPGILAGILLMLGLYSINLRIQGGSANLTLLRKVKTMVSILSDAIPGTFPLKTAWISMGIGLVFVVIVICLLYWFFGTETGCALRATGNNEYMVRALGEDTDKMKIIGLMISNGLVALSGALVAQNQGYADVGMGIGSIVMGLASIVIGEVVMGNRFNFAYKLVSIAVGSILYRMIIAIVLQIGMNPNDLKLLTAFIVALALSVPVLRGKLSRRA